MKKVQSWGAAALLVACASASNAQIVAPEPLVPAEVMQHVYPVGYPPASSYSSRAVGVVYNNGGDAGTNTNGTTLGVTSWGDEMDFSVGPWASAPTRLATQLIVWVQSSGTLCPTTPTPATQQYDILVDFWADADHDYTANPMTTGTPLGSIRVAVTATCGLQTGWIVNLTGLPGGGITIPSNQVFIQYRLVDPGTNTLRVSGANQTNFPVFGIGTTLIGQSTPSYARDVSLDQILNGGTPVVVGAGAGHEHRRTSATLNTNQRSKLSGDIPPPPEPTNENLGVLTDAGLTVTRPLAAGEVKFFKFTISSNAADNFTTFLDIDTEGSTNPNVSMGLYNSGAAMISADADEASALNAMLTYGIGRRSEIGDGRQYDGRDGELAPGDYILAVASGNANFGDAYSVSGMGADAGDVVLRFRTNVNGTPAAPAVVPSGPTVTNVGQLLAPGAPTTAQTPGRLDTIWYSFSLCAPASGSNYLDIDMSQSNTGADSEIFLFDSNGNLLVQNDDADADNAAPFYLLSQLSFGNTGPRPPAHANAQDFAGQDGTLNPGTYYLGVGLFNTAEVNGAATNGRFHLRSASGSTLPLTLAFLTNISECAPLCGTSDFNGDGDFGTDADIEAFFACLAGNCCPTCYAGGSDFNADGDFGTDADIESFFRVLAGGPC